MSDQPAKQEWCELKDGDVVWIKARRLREVFWVLNSWDEGENPAECYYQGDVIWQLDKGE